MHRAGDRGPHASASAGPALHWAEQDPDPHLADVERRAAKGWRDLQFVVRARDGHGGRQEGGMLRQLASLTPSATMAALLLLGFLHLSPHSWYGAAIEVRRMQGGRFRFETVSIANVDERSAAVLALSLISIGLLLCMIVLHLVRSSWCTETTVTAILAIVAASMSIAALLQNIADGFTQLLPLIWVLAVVLLLGVVTGALSLALHMRSHAKYAAQLFSQLPESAQHAIMQDRNAAVRALAVRQGTSARAVEECVRMPFGGIAWLVRHD